MAVQYILFFNDVLYSLHYDIMCMISLINYTVLMMIYYKTTIHYRKSRFHYQRYPPLCGSVCVFFTCCVCHMFNLILCALLKLGCYSTFLFKLIKSSGWNSSCNILAIIVHLPINVVIMVF